MSAKKAVDRDSPEDRAKRKLLRLITEVDRLEREWNKLSDEEKAANPKLAEWFAKAPTKH